MSPPTHRRGGRQDNSAMAVKKPNRDQFDAVSILNFGFEQIAVAG
jgi:hypothetical protein